MLSKFFHVLCSQVSTVKLNRNTVHTRMPTWNLRLQISREPANLHSHSSNSEDHWQTTFPAHSSIEKGESQEILTPTLNTLDLYFSANLSTSSTIPYSIASVALMK